MYNEIIKQISTKHGFTFVDNSSIDNTALNGSKLRLNGKGSALLASNFIKFLQADRKSLDSSNQTNAEDFQIPSLYQLGNMLMTMAMSKRPTSSRKKNGR